jgi:hypothetical protein
MTITFLTNSPKDFNGGAYSTAAGYYDSAYVDGSIRISTTTGSLGPISFGHDVDLSGESLVSCHFDFWSPRTNSAGADGEWGRWSAPDGTLKVYLDILNGAFGIRVYNGAAGFASSAFTWFPLGNGLQTIDIVYEDDAVNCTASLYSGGILQLTATVASSGAAVMPTVMQMTHEDSVGFNSEWFAYSQVIFAHGETTIGMKMERIDADTIGFHQDMSTSILEINDDDRGTGWSSGTNADKNSYNLPTYTVPAGRLIHSLNVQSVVRIGTTGPVNIRPFLRISSTDYDGVADYTPPSHQFGKHNESWTVDPATTVAWTAAGVGGAEVGFQVKT